MFWEFRQYTVTGNPSGHSIMQRLEFFKTAISIIKKNFFIGVGTGDINDHFLQTYEEQKTTLLPERRLRAHNQYLTFFAIFGIIGFLWFIFSLIFPLIFLRKYNSFLYLSFFVIAALSMLTEDTLETQAGVTFFAFFNSLFVFYDSDSRNKTS